MTLNENTKEIVSPNIKEQLNKTTAFMLPALDLTGEKASYKMLEQFGFVNCYIDHKQSLYRDETHIFMVFNLNKQIRKDFYKLYNIYKSFKNFITDYMVDHNLIVVVFKVKSKWQNTYEMFKQSRYSQMSREYADMFKQVTLAGNVNVGYQYLVIHKHKEYREHLEKELDVQISPKAELMDRLDLTKEIFDYERLIKIQPGEGQCQIGETTGSGLHI